MQPGGDVPEEALYSFMGRELMNDLNRRSFLKTSAAGAAALAAPSGVLAGPRIESPETLVQVRVGKLSEKQKSEICFPWDHQDRNRGLLRCYLSNNWRITKPGIKSDFYTAEQQALIRQIFEGIVNPDWIQRFDRQFKDDLG